MKRYLSNFKLSESFVTNSIYDCLNGNSSGTKKWYRNDTSHLFKEYYLMYCEEYNIKPNLNDDKIKKLLHPCCVDDIPNLYKLVGYIGHKIYNEIVEKNIMLDPIQYTIRFDKTSNKTREIGTASIKQQIYDYIVVNACRKMFMAKIGKYQCASLPKRGQLFGKSAIEVWIRTNPQKCRYIFKADVKKYYPSIDHNILKTYLKRDIKNDDILYILFTLIDSYKCGLCIGSYLSQYLANYILSYAYHYISEQVYKIRRGKRVSLIKHVLFYMDDIILFGSNKKDVKMASKMLEKYLLDKFNLTLKPSHQLFKLDSRPIDMMGYKIYTYKTTIRRKTFLKANKILLKQKGKKNITIADAYKVVSYNGYFVHSWSKKYQNKVKMNETLIVAKEMISNVSKKRCRVQ